MKNRQGFTLVELVVVVMILGILAAVAAPKLLSTSSSATENGVQQTLAVVRDAVERYAAENGGNLPGADGVEATFKSDIGGYLRGPFPKCPVVVKNNGVIMTNEADILDGITELTSGWVYAYTGASAGEFIINSDNPLASDSSITYDDL